MKTEIIEQLSAIIAVILFFVVAGGAESILTLIGL